MDRWTDGHTDVQRETIIPHHYHMVGYENVKVPNSRKNTQQDLSFLLAIFRRNNANFM